MNFILIWIFIGLAVNIYYFSTKHKEYTKRIQDKELTVKNLIVGFLLTLVIFPVAIYNNEIRK